MAPQSDGVEAMDCFYFSNCTVGFQVDARAFCNGSICHPVFDRENCCVRVSMRQSFLTNAFVFIFGAALLTPKVWQNLRRAWRKTESRVTRFRATTNMRATQFSPQEPPQLPSEPPAPAASAGLSLPSLATVRSRASVLVQHLTSGSARGARPSSVMLPASVDLSSGSFVDDTESPMTNRATVGFQSFGFGTDEYDPDFDSDDDYDPDACKNTSYLNYLSFLWICFLMFFSMAVIAAVLMLPLWSYWGGLNPLFAASFSRDGVGRISLARPLPGQPVDITPGGVAVVYLMAVLFGVVVLCFSHLLLFILEKNTPEDINTAKKIDRTLWLKGLPRCDPLRPWDPFKLTDEEFHRVRSDLGFAIDEALRDRQGEGHCAQPQASRKARRGATIARVDKIEIVPAVDTWHQISLACRDAAEQAFAYNQLRGQSRYFDWWYVRQAKSLQLQAQTLQRRLLEFVLSNKQLSGSAFVTFRTPEDRNLMMRKEVMSCGWMWLCRPSFSYFTFGRPPFASVTLKCEPAPHPEDLNWHFLHMELFARRIRFYLCTCLLFIVLLGYHRPEMSADLVLQLEDGLNITAWWMHRDETKQAHGFRLMRSIGRSLPQVPLLVLNAAILPEIICRITLLERATRKSMFERRGLVLYFYFLVFSTIIFPLFSKEKDEDHLGLDVFNFRNNSAFLSNPACWTGQALGEIVVQVEGIFTLQYLFSTAFLSNLFYVSAGIRNRLLQSFMVEYLCVTERERKETLEPFPFTWGWNYAWSLSVVFMALVFGPLIPATLPIGAVFFFLKYNIDRHNLDYKVFSLGSENQGIFTRLASHRLRSIVGIFWVCMGCSFLFLQKQIAMTWLNENEKHYCDVGDNRASPTCHCLSFACCMHWLLILAGVCVFLFNQVRSPTRVARPGDPSTLRPTRSNRSLQLRDALICYRSTFCQRLGLTHEIEPQESLNADTSRCSWDVRKNKKVIWPDKEVHVVARDVRHRLDPGLSPHAAAERLRQRGFYWLTQAPQIILRGDTQPLGGSGIELQALPPQNGSAGDSSMNKESSWTSLEAEDGSFWNGRIEEGDEHSSDGETSSSSSDGAEPPPRIASPHQAHPRGVATFASPKNPRGSQPLMMHAMSVGSPNHAEHVPGLGSAASFGVRSRPAPRPSKIKWGWVQPSKESRRESAMLDAALLRRQLSPGWERPSVLMPSEFPAQEQGSPTSSGWERPEAATGLAGPAPASGHRLLPASWRERTPSADSSSSSFSLLPLPGASSSGSFLPPVSE